MGIMEGIVTIISVLCLTLIILARIYKWRMSFTSKILIVLEELRLFFGIYLEAIEIWLYITKKQTQTKWHELPKRVKKGK